MCLYNPEIPKKPIFQKIGYKIFRVYDDYSLGSPIKYGRYVIGQQYDASSNYYGFHAFCKYSDCVLFIETQLKNQFKRLISTINIRLSYAICRCRFNNVLKIGYDGDERINGWSVPEQFDRYSFKGFPAFTAKNMIITKILKRFPAKKS